MKRLNKILLIIASVLIILILTLALVISPITKNYVEKHSKELIGRKMHIHDLHINIFKGTLEMDSVSMYESNDKDVFASIDTFFVNLTLSKLLGKNLEISEFKIIRPYLVVLQKGEVFNFDDLISKKSKADTTHSTFPKSITIRNINFKGGRLVYTDQLLKNTIIMNDLAVAIPEISFGSGNTNGGFHLKIGDRATLDSKLRMDMETNKFKFNILVKDLALNIFKPYIQTDYNIKQFEGFVNCNLLITGNMNHIMDFKLNGTGSVRGFNLTNSYDEPVASAEIATMKMNNVFYKTSTYIFDYIHGTNVKLNYVLHPKTTNFSALFKPQVNATTSTTPMTFKIKDLHLSNSQLVYTDQTLNSPYTLPINKIDFLAKDFDMNGTNEINMKGYFPKGGFVKFNWKGNMNDLSNQKINLTLQNMNLNLISPYCKFYTAYDITTGNMNYTSRNNIQHNNILSFNNLDVYKVNVGKKHKELKVKYHVPLKLALYIMKDKDDKIKFDLPVKGNLKDPKFSYSKIIIKTMMNLMVKVAVAPLKFLANSLGMNPDKMESIPIEPLQSGLTAEQYSEMNSLASVIKKKPDMVLTLTQYVNLNDALTDFKLYKTKVSYLNSMHSPGSDPLPTFDDVNEIQNNDKDFLEYLDSIIQVQGKISNQAALEQKINSLYVQDSIQIGLMNKLEEHNSLLKNYLMTSCEIPEKNLILKTASPDSLKIYKEKACYKIGMTLPSAEAQNE